MPETQTIQDTTTNRAVTPTATTAQEVPGSAKTTRVAIVGASGYTGAELLRLIAGHPNLELVGVTSNSTKGQRLDKVHPHMRGARDEIRTLRCIGHDEIDTIDADVTFLGVPHGKAMDIAPSLIERGTRVVDLSADFRLRDPANYAAWYGRDHTAPELLDQAAYGIAELHRDEYANAPLISGAGCIATTAIASLYPLAAAGIIDNDHIVVDAKIGSSAGGIGLDAATHHVERQRAIRPYSAAGHRHTAEVEQELTSSHGTPKIAMSCHAVELVRGCLTTSHVYLNDDNRDLTEKDIWKLYRAYVGDEPFLRVVKERSGIHRVPDPRLLAGTNVAEMGFELDERTGRLVVFGALDNLTKGAAGAAIQNMNIIRGYPETTGLSTMGMFPYA